MSLVVLHYGNKVWSCSRCIESLIRKFTRREWSGKLIIHNLLLVHIYRVFYIDNREFYKHLIVESSRQFSQNNFITFLSDILETE